MAAGSGEGNGEQEAGLRAGLRAITEGELTEAGGSVRN